MEVRDIRLARLAWTSVASAGLALSAQAADPADTGEPATPTRVVVSATMPDGLLGRDAPVASRLDLTVRETPATIETVDTQTMRERGYQTVSQAVDSVAGASSGGAPGSPSQFTMRGFTGGQVTVLRDGVYLGPADMTYRPQNTFNLASVDVLKGPGGVLYGQGAIAGTVNVVSKKASLKGPAFDAILTHGRFDSSQAGIGANVVLGPRLAVRADLSRTASKGFVKGARADSVNGTLSLVWQPHVRLGVELGLDYLTDHPSRYFGTPLVPAAFAGTNGAAIVATPDGTTVDRRLRDIGYNVADAGIASTQYLARAGLRWHAAEGVVVRNDAYYLYAKRTWKNAESYAFNPASGLVDRDRFFVFHDQHLAGNRVSASVSKPVAGFANRFVAGIDYCKLDFVRTRGFPDGDSVDPLRPTAGSFGALVGRRSPTRWNNAALFVEDALDLNERLKLVGGARVERFRLERENYGPDGVFQAGTSFTRTYRPANWRLGVVYQGPRDWSPYAQYSTGQDPVGANILLVNAGQNVGLSRSRQAEIGIKTGLEGGRGQATLAYYAIVRKNLLTQTSADVVDTAGMQKSRGLEATVDYRPLASWKISANVAYTRAGYRNFIDTSNGVDASGHRPANVPRWCANVWNSYSGVAGMPLELGAGVRYVGERYGNTANTLLLKSHTLVNLYATYRLARNVDLTARVNNATDRFYVQWADVNYPSQVLLGSPLTYEVGLATRF